MEKIIRSTLCTFTPRTFGLAKSRVNREAVCALTASPMSSATTRSTARVLSPRKNASRINSSPSAARRFNRTGPAGKNARCRVRALTNSHGAKTRDNVALVKAVPGIGSHRTPFILPDTEISISGLEGQPA
jgi:hypothetical protein